MFKKAIILSFLCATFSLFAQNGNTSKVNLDSGLIQFSGLLLSSDSIFPIPFATIHVIGKPYGTYSNLDGYFSFPARLGDTIVFTHVEFQETRLVIPDTLHDYKYSIVKLMSKDTFNFPGHMIMAMPPRATFDYIFATQDIPNDDMARAKENLDREELKEQAASLSGSDASEAYKILARNNIGRPYYATGQIPPMNIMNPFAWAQFFEAWKRGDYKRKKK
ncbi:MAG: carboxypeptidase-like regulatory domain-containing protein [Bacteroidia bacterium]|nr:carboxypeptidase-like regulatory domain-containing protein [Bacteroidia bacterium]